MIGRAREFVGGNGVDGRPVRVEDKPRDSRLKSQASRDSSQVDGKLGISMYSKSQYPSKPTAEPVALIARTPSRERVKFHADF